MSMQKFDATTPWVTTALLMILIAVAFGFAVVEIVGAQPLPLRVQATDTVFSVPVSMPNGGTKQVTIAGFERITSVTQCVLVSESGALAVLAGGCPRK